MASPEIGLLNKNHATVKVFAKGCWLAVLGMCLQTSVFAQQWVVSPRVSFNEIYTDNLELRSDEVALEDFITRISPGLTASKQDERFTFDFNYQLEHFLYLDESDRDTTFHQGSLASAIQAVENLLTFDVSTAYYQTIIDPADPGGLGNFVDTGNRTDSFSFDIGSTIDRQFGNLALNAQYRYGLIDYRNEGTQQQLDDSTRQRASLSFGTRQEQIGFGWVISGESERIEYDFGPEQEFLTAELELNYDVSQGVELFGVGGAENDPTQDLRTAGLDASFWRAGLRWQGTRSSIVASVGNRFFGNTYAIEWNRKSSVLNLRVKYSEGPTTVSQRLFGRVVNLDPTNVPGRDENPAITSEVFLSKLFQAELALEFDRSSFRVSIYDDDREFIDSNEDSRTTGIETGWRWNFSPKSNLGVGVEWNQDDFRQVVDVGPEADTIQYTLAVGTQLGRRTTASLELQHWDRETVVNNSAILSFDMVF